MKIVGQLKAMLGLDKTKFDRGLDGAEKKSNQFGSAIKKIGGIIAAAFSIGAIISFSKEAMKLASTAEGIRTAFERLNKPDLLENLRKATRGTVSDVTLMQKAVQARNFKIPLEQLATYFEFATKRAIQTGEAVDYLVDSIITGIGRKSVLVMDNLGISAYELQQETKKVGDFGTAAGIIIRRELTSMGDVADTTAIKMQKLAISGSRLKEAWGAWLNTSSVIASFRSYFTDLFNAFADENATFQTKVQALLPGNKTKAGQRLTWKRGQEQTEKERAAEGVNPAGSTGLQKLLANAEGPAKKATKTIADLRAEIDEYKTLIDETTISDQARRNELMRQIKATEDLITKYTTLNEKITRMEAIAKIGAIAVPSPGMPALPGIQKGPLTVGQQTSAQITQMTEALQKQQIAVDILATSFEALFTSTEGGFKAMIDSIISGLRRLVTELLARVAVLAILNVITGGEASIGTIIKGAAASMGFSKGAEGGTVPGGYANDTYPTLLSSGETILTPEQSRGLSGKIQVQVTGDIQARAIALIGRRTEGEN